MMEYESLTLPQFLKRYSDEESCLQAIFDVRWPRGYICPECGHNDGYRLKSRPSMVQCCLCGAQRSITAGTIFEKTKTPLPIWFLIIYQVAQDKGGASVTRLSKQLGMHYDTVWHILHKIREAMKTRDERLTLAGYIEMDEALFGGKGKSALDNKFKVLVMVESEGHQAGNLVMRVVDDTTYDSIKPVIAEKVDSDPPAQVFRTDGYQAHTAVLSLGHALIMRKTDYKTTAIDPLRCAHLAIQHLREFFKGTYHNFCKTYMQRYLDEFCFRWNRRDKWEQIASRLITACSFQPPITYTSIVNWLATR